MEKYGISAEVIDLRSVRPIDWDCIFRSVSKTGAVLATDIGHGCISVASEIVSKVTQNKSIDLKFKPITICSPDHAVPTSQYLASEYYPDHINIVNSVRSIFGQSVTGLEVGKENQPSDVLENGLKVLLTRRILWLYGSLDFRCRKDFIFVGFEQIFKCSWHFSCFVRWR